MSDSIAPFCDFTLDEAAAYMRVKKSYIYANIRRIDHFKVAGRLFFQKTALDKYLAGLAVASVPARSTGLARSGR